MEETVFCEPSSTIMFIQAIEEVARFTRPINTIDRCYGSTTVRPGAATLFFVNELGVAITCKHVADLIPHSQATYKKFNELKQKRNDLVRQGKSSFHISELVKQYGFDNNTTCEMLLNFVDCVSPVKELEVTTHADYDLAIVRFKQYERLHYSSYARFVKDSSILKQGAYLCRLGFPFPEFTNYAYDASSDSIKWTQEGVVQTPSFPIDGMLTRHLANAKGLFGIEMSTPGLRGQSGGPLFTTEGIVCGMQFATNHLHLGFDMRNQEIISNGEKLKVTNQPMLHVGYCIHVDVIKKFLSDHSVKYYEA